MVLCVGLNSTDTPCSPGPGSTLKVPLGNGTAMLRPEAENTRADLADGPPGSESGSPYLCCLPRSASWRRARSFVCSRPQSTQNQMIPRPAVTSCPRPYLHLGWPLEYAGDSKPVARSFRGTVYSPRFNMSGSLAMFDATRLASSIVHLLCLQGFGLGRTAIDVCHGKTVCVPHHIASGKFVGVPWGRQAASHSITSSAPAVSPSGTSRPRAFAVLRLITNSNFADCTTGRSPGFSPLRMRPT